jgi:hypothetical protein
MKSILSSQSLMTILIVLCATFNVQQSRAEGIAVWQLQTNTGKQIPLSEVKYLLSSDDDRTFSVVGTSSNIDSVTSISFVKSADTGIGNIHPNKGGISIYPSPVTSSLTVSGIRSGQTICITSLSGVTLHRQVSTDGSTILDLSSLPKGAYLLSTAGTTVKFIKK